MTEEQDKIIRSRITALSFGIIVLMLIFMVVLAVTGKAGTPLFPIGLAVLLTAYWAAADVLPVVWRKLLEGRPENQRRAYFFYALTDAAGLAGLVYFVVNMTSTVGVMVYVVSIFLKRRFWDDFQGTRDKDRDSDDDSDSASDDDSASDGGSASDGVSASDGDSASDSASTSDGDSASDSASDNDSDGDSASDSDGD